jgi:heterodisulfide reductase subunit D
MIGDNKACHFTIRQLMELDACTRCGQCSGWCETYGKQGDDFTAPMLKLREFRSLLMEEDRRLVLSRLFSRRRNRSQEWLKEFAEGLYRCTMCARCVEACPVQINLLRLWLSMRQEIVDRGVHPEKLDQAREAIAQNHNVVNYPNEERAMWVDYMLEAPPDLYQRPKAEVVYFVGCMSSFSPAIQGIPQAYAQVLEKAGVDFTIWGEREWCCGFPLRAAGMLDQAEAVIEHNIALLREIGARVVTFNCPSCYNMWREEYGPRLPGVELLHSTEMLARLLRQGRVQARPLDLKVTYHDPCDLGRNSGVYQAPREVLRGLPDLQFLEAEDCRERAHCCGGGGDLEIADSGLAHGIALDTYHTLLRGGAEAIVTACPQCTRMFRAVLPNSERKAQVLDLTELVLKTIQEE